MSALCDSARKHAVRACPGSAGQRCNVTLANYASNRRAAGTMAQALAGAWTPRPHQGRHKPAPAMYPDMFEHNTIRNQAVGQARPQT
ncbi:MAG TPA: hypothetical protein DD666_15590 [Advenella kashmirensis]|uniref:Uncharacterized protein n=1 Tax=Advenella kashmirensis TaxID=310575 RepID=A0A356LIJ8_9BURK|nr:hypothetical protein [Advenella kashmirensis]